MMALPSISQRDLYTGPNLFNIWDRNRRQLNFCHSSRTSALCCHPPITSAHFRHIVWTISLTRAYCWYNIAANDGWWRNRGHIFIAANKLSDIIASDFALYSGFTPRSRLQESSPVTVYYCTFGATFLFVIKTTPGFIVNYTVIWKAHFHRRSSAGLYVCLAACPSDKNISEYRLSSYFTFVTISFAPNSGCSQMYMLEGSSGWHVWGVFRIQWARGVFKVTCMRAL